MRKVFFKRTIVFLLFTVGVFSCSKVPVTGRRQMNLLPESTLMSMSLENYNKFLKENNTVSATQKDAKLVKKVGSKISHSVETYLKKTGKSKRVKNYKWEFNLVNDNTVNAWCMPGGKVVVYSGIMPVTEGEDGLAVIMGHEIAHAIARHGNERMSQQLLVALGGVSLAVALNEKPQKTQELFLLAYGVGAGSGVLAYSRKHESEADKMGMVFMAKAGYNPENAVDFWYRMKEQTGGSKVPNFLRTHPTHDKRIKKIREYLPEAMMHYDGDK